MKIKAIIFDMDGTIIDTDIIWKSATKNLLTARGIDEQAIQQSNAYAQVHGLATHKSCALLKELFGLQDSLETLIHEKSQFANQLYVQEVRFIEGFVPFHAKLTQANLKSGIATNANDQTVQITDQVLNLKQYFGEHIYNVTCVGNKCKPDPALYLHAAEKLNINPEYCVAIEDSAYGIQAAKKAGMFCIGINTGRNRKLLEEADLIVENYQEITIL